MDFIRLRTAILIVFVYEINFEIFRGIIRNWIVCLSVHFLKSMSQTYRHKGFLYDLAL